MQQNNKRYENGNRASQYSARDVNQGDLHSVVFWLAILLFGTGGIFALGCAVLD
jgi:hypothetical protein